MSNSVVANLCPYLEGGVVTQARAFYNIIFDGFYKFNDNCNQNIGGKITKSELPIKEEKKIQVLLKTALFPNPNNGNFVISLNEKVKSKMETVFIYDVAGKLVYEDKLDTEALDNMEVRTTLANGSYLVKIKLQDGSFDLHRLLITK
ncbi:MAG: T9SS type A sorting domain-containing protein [Sphingobacteriaceae bacterium]|nr:T9SS type A sorting domain-containing protein [Sphingobacteriaceae bacterium]